MAEFAHLQAKAGVGGRGRRSPLTRWMVTHQAEFAAMLADKKPGWDEVALILTGMGLRDGQGKPPDGDRARKAWWNVQQEKAGPTVKRSRVRALQPLALSKVAVDVRLLPVPPPGIVDGLQPQVPFEPPFEEVAGTVATGQDRPAAESILAPPTSATAAVTADPARVILDEGDGDGLGYEGLPSDIVPPPLMTNQALPRMSADPWWEPEEIKAPQSGNSADVEPAAPDPTPGAAEASPNPSPIPAALAPAPTPGPIAPVTQDPTVVAPGKVQKPSWIPSFLRRSS